MVIEKYRVDSVEGIQKDLIVEINKMVDRITCITEDVVIKDIKILADILFIKRYDIDLIRSKRGCWELYELYMWLEIYVERYLNNGGSINV